MLQLQRHLISSINTSESPNYHISKRTNINHLKNCLKKRKKIKINSTKNYSKANNEERVYRLINPGKNNLTNSSASSLNSSSSSTLANPNLIQRRRRRGRLEASVIELVCNNYNQEQPTTNSCIQMQSSRLRINIIPTLLKHHKKYTRSSNNH